MEPTTRLQDFEDALKPYAERYEWRDDFRLDIIVRPDKLLAAVQKVLDLDWRYLSAITGVDLGAPEENPEDGLIELLYHFVEGPYILTLRLRVPYRRAVAPSVCGLIPPATLYEREIIEMFGVELEGTPSTDRLLLPDDWPDGVYPLRKAFKGL